MTEDEWLSCSDSRAMLPFLRSRGVGDRKWRLFATACYRDAWDLIEEAERSSIGAWHRAVRLAEHLADNEASRDEVDQAVMDLVGLVTPGSGPACSLRVGAMKALAGINAAWGAEGATRTAAGARFRAAESAARTPEELWRSSDATLEDGRAAARATFVRHADLLRDLFNNPFRPVVFSSDWRTSTVVALARGIYDERAFDRLPLLMNALMDEGCADEHILTHCRCPGPHCRGCWVVDLVLGKE